MNIVSDNQNKLNGIKDAVLFHQHLCKSFTTHFRLQLLSQAAYSGTILPNDVDIKIVIKYLHKSCSTLAPKMLVKLTPGRACNVLLYSWSIVVSTANDKLASFFVKLSAPTPTPGANVIILHLKVM